jgi:SAM-dependent methyltransferase
MSKTKSKGERLPHELAQQYDLLEIGCGPDPNTDGLHADIKDWEAVEHRTDIRDLPAAWDNSFSRALSEHTFEHLSVTGIEQALSELARVVRPGGRITIVTPYGALHDHSPFHETRLSLQTWQYILPDVCRYLPDDHPVDAATEPPAPVEVVNVDVSVWLDSPHPTVRPFSWALGKAADRWLSDRWDRLPVVGPAVAGEVTLTLRVVDSCPGGSP